MRLRRSLADSARSLYRFPAVRTALLVAGPARWRLPRTLRWRIESQAAVARKHRRELLRFGGRESVVPTDGPVPAPTFGHRIVARPYRVPVPYVCELEHVWLVGRNATPVTRDGRVLLTPYRNEPRMLGLEAHVDLERFVASKAYEQPWPDDAVERPLFSAVTRVDVNYAHWLLETCGQLEGVRAWAERSAAAPTVLVRSDGPRFQRASLAMLGFADALTDWTPDRPPLAVDRFVVTSIPGTPVAVSPRSVAWLRRELVDGRSRPPHAGGPVPPPAAEGRTRIFIARPRGGWRYVENADEVERALGTRGFTTLAAEHLSFDEQVAVFGSAEMVVAQHGAGLTNLLFAPADCSVVELTGGYGDGLFYSLANAIGQRYRCLDGVTDGDSMTVDVPALLRLVDDLIDDQAV